MNTTHMPPPTILWRRIDAPGHDACRIDHSSTGSSVSGTAVFLHEGLPACLSYVLACDVSWRAVSGEVEGWIGAVPVRLSIARNDAGCWCVNGNPSGIDCIDLDFGFTPATNVAPLRRLKLSIGDAAEAPAAWLDVAAGALTVLSQRYTRRTESAYWYEAPSVGYAALLEVEPQTCFVRQYPGLWEAIQ